MGNMQLLYLLYSWTTYNLVLSAKLGVEEINKGEPNPDEYGRGECALKHTAIEVDACYQEKEDHFCHNLFRDKQCTSTNPEPCLLGRETDKNGCVKDCFCAHSGLFQGDIMVGANEYKALEEEYGLIPQSKDASKSVPKWDNMRKNGLCYVPYVLDDSLGAKAKKAIRSAMDDYEKNTCIRFKKQKAKQHLIFVVSRGCWSHIGRVLERQRISIGRGCEIPGVVKHEIMHALGFKHEQARPDRDDNIQVLYQNIKPRMRVNFDKMAESDLMEMGSPYDKGSIMHYGGTYFSKNKKPTILDRETNQPIKAQRKDFSDEDLKQINKMYKCKVL